MNWCIRWGDSPVHLKVFSVLDMSTNYCNIHDLYCSDEQCHVLDNKLTYTEDISASSGQHDTSNCYLV